jgi:hypothetical protein
MATAIFTHLSLQSADLPNGNRAEKKGAMRRLCPHGRTNVLHPEQPHRRVRAAHPAAAAPRSSSSRAGLADEGGHIRTQRPFSRGVLRGLSATDVTHMETDARRSDGDARAARRGAYTRYIGHDDLGFPKLLAQLSESYRNLFIY